MQVTLTKDMKFLKCIDSNGNLMSSVGEIEKSGNFYILRVGPFKQTLSAGKYNKILEVNNVEQPRIEAEYSVAADTTIEGIEDLESKSREELIMIAEGMFARGQVDHRWAKSKLIQAIKKARNG